MTAVGQIPVAFTPVGSYGDTIPDLMWQYLGFTARLEHLGPPETIPG